MKKFKTVSKDLALYQNQIQQDEEGRTIINMNVRNEDEFISSFSFGEKKVITSEAASFIENRTSGLISPFGYTLRIHLQQLSSMEEQAYQEALQEYYIESFRENEIEIHRNRLASLLLYLSGLFVLVFMVLFEYLVTSLGIWSEVIDIVAWVFIWEATTLFFIENRKLKLRRNRLLAYLHMKVEFYILPKE